MRLAKRLISMLAVAALLFSATGGFPMVRAEGTTVVYKLDDLKSKISANEDVTLGCDIKVTSWSNISYMGVFDGNGYTLDCSELGTRSNAMFTTLTGTIKNVTIKNLTFEALSTSTDARGALTNKNQGCIQNVHLVDVSASTTLDKALGAITAINYGTIENCTVSGSVSGKNHVGGIVGTTNSDNAANTITKCINYADVTASGGRVGGIVGTLRAGGAVSYCVNYGTIQTTSTDTNKLVGGIATTNADWSSTVASYCLNAGRLETAADSTYVGGIIGTDMTLSSPGVKCYSTVAPGNKTCYDGEKVDSLTSALVDADHLTNVFAYTDDANYPIALSHAYTNGVGYTDLQTAVTAAVAAGSAVALAMDANETVTVNVGETLTLDLNGYTLGKLVNNGTANVIDSSTKDYTNTAYGKIKAVEGTVNSFYRVDDGNKSHVYNGYAAYNDSDNAYSFHYFEVKIASAVLRPTEAGIGYKLHLAGNAQVKALLDSNDAFGVTVYVEGNEANGKSASAGSTAFAVGEQTKMVMIKNIMSKDAETSANAANGTMKICVNAYLNIGDEKIEISYTAGKSLKDMAESANGKLSGYDDAQISALKAMYTDFKMSDEAFKDWSIANIAALADAN